MNSWRCAFYSRAWTELCFSKKFTFSILIDIQLATTYLACFHILPVNLSKKSFLDQLESEYSKASVRASTATLPQLARRCIRLASWSPTCGIWRHRAQSGNTWTRPRSYELELRTSASDYLRGCPHVELKPMDVLTQHLSTFFSARAESSTICHRLNTWPSTCGSWRLRGQAALAWIFLAAYGHPIFCNA